MVVVVVDDVEAERLGIAGAFVFSDFVFLQREDVRIAIIYSRCDAVLHHAFDDGRRTWRAAGVKQHLGLAAWNRYLELFLHGLNVIKMTAITAITKPM